MKSFVCFASFVIIVVKLLAEKTRNHMEVSQGARQQAHYNADSLNPEGSLMSR
jgi:hypothetical protein